MRTLQALVKALQDIARSLRRLVRVIEEEPSIELHVAAVYGRKGIVNIDRGSLPLVDTEKVLLSIAGKDAGGVPRAIPPDQFSWTVDNGAVITLETTDVDADGNTVELDPYTRMARTPTPGTVVVTVTGPDGNTETMTLVVANSGPGEIGLSAGAPVPE